MAKDANEKGLAHGSSSLAPTDRRRFLEVTDPAEIEARRLARKLARASLPHRTGFGGKRNFKIELAYDGAGFRGWQKQPGARTVEGVLLEALRALDPDLQALSVAGRTDRGVHATGQVVSFWTYRPLEVEAVAASMEGAAPTELAITSVRMVDRRFHARFSAQAREYVYLHDDGGTLDVARINRLLAPMLGRHDFFAFARQTPKGFSTVRRMLRAEARRVVRDGRPVIRFAFRADGFVRKQIRVTVATVLDQAPRAGPDDTLGQILNSRDRSQTSEPAPPEGLYLARIAYDAL